MGRKYRSYLLQFMYASAFNKLFAIWPVIMHKSRIAYLDEKAMNHTVLPYVSEM